MRARGVSTSNTTRGPVTTGYAERSSRTATTRVTFRRSSPQVISRGTPLNRSVRTSTLTGSTRTIATGVTPFSAGSVVVHRGIAEDRTDVRFDPDTRPNRRSMSSVRRNVHVLCVTLGVTARGVVLVAGLTRALGAVPPLDGRHRVALERRREVRAHEPRPGHRAVAEALADRIGRLCDLVATRLVGRREQ